MESVDQLARKAMGLRPIEKIRLVEAILSSLETPSSDVEKNWVSESESRYDAYKKGELAAIDWEDVKKRYES